MERISREDILGVFEELVAQQGLDRVTMKELAREAGISVGSIYRHFDGKDDLVLAVEKRWRRHVEQRNAMIVESDRPPSHKLHDIVVRHVDMFSALVRENQAVYELLMGAMRLRYIGRTLDDTRKEVFESMIESTRTVLDEGVCADELAVADIDRTARLFVTAFTDFFSPAEIVEREHAEVVADAEAMFDILMTALRSETK